MAEIIDPEGFITNRGIEQPLHDWESTTHILRATLQCSIVIMPWAFQKVGPYIGVLGTVMCGFLCVHNMEIFVKSAHTLCKRTNMPKLSFAEVARQAILNRFPGWHSLAALFYHMVNGALVMGLEICSAFYATTFAKYTMYLLDNYFERTMDLEKSETLVMVGALCTLCLLMHRENLKSLVSLSVFGNTLIAVSVMFLLGYLLVSMPCQHYRSNNFDINSIPLFFGSTLLAMQSIAVVMAVENEMQNPAHLVKRRYILKNVMVVVMVLYSVFGLWGYWKFGDRVETDIVLNLPLTLIPTHVFIVLLAAANLCSIKLHLKIASNIMRLYIVDDNPDASKKRCKMVAGILPVMICILIGMESITRRAQNSIDIYGLAFVVYMSWLALILPPLIELLTYATQGYGQFWWILLKDNILISCGMASLMSGIYYKMSCLDSWYRN